MSFVIIIVTYYHHSFVFYSTLCCYLSPYCQVCAEKNGNEFQCNSWQIGIIGVKMKASCLLLLELPWIIHY